MFVVLLFSCFAYTEYTQLGGSDALFNTGETLFNNEIDNDKIVSTVKTLNNPSYNPYVKDLDGDGEKEIIILDSTSLKIYDSELKSVDGINLFSNVYSNIEIVLIDGNYNIILANQIDTLTVNVMSYTFDGTLLSLTSSVNYSVSQTPRDIVIKCGYDENIDNCMLITTADNVNNIGNVLILSTWTYTDGIIDNFEYSNNYEIKYCMPSIPLIILDDYDEDDTKEYIFSYFKADGSGSSWVDSGNIDVFYTNSSHNLIFEQNMYKNIGSYSFNMEFCSSPLTQYTGVSMNNLITSPIVFDFDDNPSNGHEIIIGLVTQPEIQHADFKMYSFKTDGTILGDYPEYTDANGFLMSNPVKMNAFTDTDDTDICVMGFDYNTDELILGGLDLLCASGDSGIFGDYSHQFYYLAGLDYNLTYNVNDNHLYHLIHSVKSNSHIENGVNLDDILTSYGTFYLDYALLTDLLVFSYEIPQKSSTVIPIDLYNYGYNQLLFYTDTNVWLYTDGFVNKGCGQTDNNCIKEGSSINPSIDATWKKDTDLEIRLNLEDINNDNVSGRATIYYGTGDQQISAWSEWYRSGTTITIDELETNHKILNGILRIEVRDSENPEMIQILDLSFSIADEGIIFGDAIYYFGETEEEIEEEIEEILQGEYRSPCDTNDDCNSGVCSYGFCGLRMGGDDCTSNSQCLSNRCIADKCTKAGVWAGINMAKTDNFGNDESTNNFISGAVMVTLALAPILAGGGSIIGLLVGGILFIASALFFTLVGWLSGWILLIMIIVLLIAFFMIVMLGGR